MSTPTLAWYFSAPPDEQGRFRVARRGDIYTVPCTLTEPGQPELCRRGLHASVYALDALSFASSPWVHRVEVSGSIMFGGDKIAGQERRHLWCMDATPVLHAFARSCALDVAHLWDMPDVVRRYLETGDESLRDAARAAARAAARDDAWAAARDAAGAAARAAAWAAAWAAEPAWQVARLREIIEPTTPPTEEV